jgi:tryptophan synthase beta subunit
MPKSKSIVVGLSGRGDKDVHTVETALASGNGHGSPAVSVTAGGRR